MSKRVLMELTKVTDYKWMIPKTGKMKVPAYVFASEKLLPLIKQDRTLEQLKNMTQLPGIHKQALCMPDAHQGYGFPIGGVAGLDYHEGGISPGGVGYDINCGVRLLKTNLKVNEVKTKIRPLIDELFKNVPSGVGVSGSVNLNISELNKVLSEGVNWALNKGYALSEDVERTEDEGQLNSDHELISDRAKKRGLNQLGSLGAGNHFLEVQEVSEVIDEENAKKLGIEKGQVMVMIHCGSRGLGHQVCSDFLRTIERTNKELINSLPDRELIYAPAGSKLASDYLLAMGGAANYAWVNRQVITHQVREGFKNVFKESKISQVYDVCHNICKVEEFDGKKLFLHRKGATRCAPKGHKLVPSVYKSIGQPVLIPGTMGTASYLLIGQETSINESFMSTAHGSGRVMSRKKANKEWEASEVKESLMSKGILVKSHSFKGISEEAPGAYKDVNEVVRVSEAADIAKRVVKLRPLGVIKG